MIELTDKEIELGAKSLQGYGSYRKRICKKDSGLDDEQRAKNTFANYESTTDRVPPLINTVHEAFEKLPNNHLLKKSKDIDPAKVKQGYDLVVSEGANERGYLSLWRFMEQVNIQKNLNGDSSQTN